PNLKPWVATVVQRRLLPTEEQNGEIGELADLIADSARDSPTPFIVAIDGRSGAGKSTLALALAAQTGATVINGDDFYSGGTAAEWDAMPPAEKRKTVLTGVASGRCWKLWFVGRPRPGTLRLGRQRRPTL
ncbi:MAG: hypothetical protein ACR2ME_09970, partial [Acidimicrobiia bacterium]